MSDDEFKPRERYQDYKLKPYHSSMLMVRKGKPKLTPMTEAEKELRNDIMELAEALNELRREFRGLRDMLTRKGVL